MRSLSPIGMRAFMDQWIRAEIGGNTQKIFCGHVANEMVPVTVVYEVNINLPSQGRGNALGLDLSRRFFLAPKQ